MSTLMTTHLSDGDWYMSEEEIEECVVLLERRFGNPLRERLGACCTSGTNILEPTDWQIELTYWKVP